MTFIFWASLAVILYVYFGYPLALAAVVRRSRSRQQDSTFLPTVSLVIAAYNEEKVLPEKLANSLELDYPRQRLEIVVVSDGSTDTTNAIVCAHATHGVVLHSMPCRGGKTRALSAVIPKTHGDILVLSDANTMYQPDAIRKLVRHFVDPLVGAVSGDVRLVDAADSHAYSEGVYYRYERWLQSLESRLGAMVGVDGAMYAIRRECFQAPSPDIILDDFVISMTVARLGYCVLYDPEACATEQGTLTSREEYRRKVRIVAGGIQALLRWEGLPRWRQPLLLFCYVSHKLLRWLLPCFLVLMFLASAVLAHAPFYRLLLFGHIVFGLVAAGYGMGVLGLRRHRWCGIPYYFCLVNGAALLGLWKGFWGMQAVTWQRTSR